MWNKHLRFNVELSLRLPPSPRGVQASSNKTPEARNKSHLNDNKEEECRVNWSDKAGSYAEVRMIFFLTNVVRCSGIGTNIHIKAWL